MTAEAGLRLVRHGPKGAEKPGLVDRHGRLRDLSGVVPDIGRETLGRAALERLAGLDPDALPEIAGPVRLGAPVSGIGKIIGLGLNYRHHAAECNLPLPQE